MRSNDQSVFISYRREDSAGYARALYNKLREHFDERHIFMDVDAIAPGLDFVDAIEKGVGACSVLIAIIGDRWFGSDGDQGNRLQNPNDYVRLEIAAALSRGIRVIPVLVDGAQMPSPVELPDDIGALTRRNALELRHAQFDQDAGRLVRTLSGIVPQRAAESRPESTPEAPTAGSHRTPAKRKRRWFTALFYLAIFALLGFGTGSGISLAFENSSAALAGAILVWTTGLIVSFRTWLGKKPSQ